MYPLAASSGFDIFTLLDEALSVPYGVRSIKNGNGSPVLSDPTGRRITTCSFTPSRIGIIASLRVYSFDSALCADCALNPTTETSNPKETKILQQRSAFIAYLDLKSEPESPNFIYPSAIGSAGIGLASHFHPSLPWVPSQNGRFDDIPHRQSEIAGLPVRSHSFPFTSTNEIGPSTRNGPFGRTVIFTAGAETGSAGTTFNTSSDIKLPLIFTHWKTFQIKPE
jgi:hypothetical protein